MSGTPATCADARRAIEERRFVGWRGLPADCTPEALFGVPLDGVWGERQLGAAFEPARTRLLETDGYYRPMAFVRDGRIVMVSGMNPQLAVPWPQLSDDLGEPDAVLDWTHATDPIPGGEWVYARRGITVFSTRRTTSSSTCRSTPRPRWMSTPAGCASGTASARSPRCDGFVVAPGGRAIPAAARPGRAIPPEAVGVAVLALHNLAVHRLLPAPAGAALNLVTAAGLSAFARHAGCSQADLGIGVEDAGRGLRLGLGAAAVAGGGVALGAALPATRRFFSDRRVSDVGRGEAAYHLTVRIPLTTALAEEVLFRGVLLALFRQRRSATTAVLWTSLLFGAWHVLPTIDHYQGNPASDLVADPSRGRRLAVLATTLSTTGAGGVFAWLRLRSRSVLAPVLAHAALNVSAYLTGRLVVNRRPTCWPAGGGKVPAMRERA